MSWVKMTMKFPGKCTVCGKTVDTGQVGFWAQVWEWNFAELECKVCGLSLQMHPAGFPWKIILLVGYSRVYLEEIQ